MAPLGADAHDVKASFIAAARRAAQAAASEASSGKERPSATRHSRAVRYGDLGRDGGSLAKRAKRNLDERRRPILLGLAAIVLALGALQVVGTMNREQAKPVTVAAPRVETKVALAPLPALPRDIAPPTTGAIEAPEARAMGAATPPSQGESASPASLADVAAREREAALAEAAKAKMDGAAAAQQSLERIANIASLGVIPANAGPAALRQAALAGEPAAVYELAARAAEGRGMARDLALAAKLFEKAAVHGLVPAQYRTGNVYEKGLGVPRDLAVAKSWYQRAADKGNARAMHNLAVLIAEGVGGQPDYAAAIGWFRRAAQHGVRDSQFNLAVLLARGLGAPAGPGRRLHVVRHRRDRRRRGRGQEARRGRRPARRRGAGGGAASRRALAAGDARQVRQRGHPAGSRLDRSTGSEATQQRPGLIRRSADASRLAGGIRARSAGDDRGDARRRLRPLSSLPRPVLSASCDAGQQASFRMGQVERVTACGRVQWLTAGPQGA